MVFAKKFSKSIKLINMMSFISYIYIDQNSIFTLQSVFISEKNCNSCECSFYKSPVLVTILQNRKIGYCSKKISSAFVSSKTFRPFCHFVNVLFETNF